MVYAGLLQSSGERRREMVLLQVRKPLKQRLRGLYLSINPYSRSEKSAVVCLDIFFSPAIVCISSPSKRRISRALSFPRGDGRGNVSLPLRVPPIVSRPHKTSHYLSLHAPCSFRSTPLFAAGLFNPDHPDFPSHSTLIASFTRTHRFRTNWVPQLEWRSEYFCTACRHSHNSLPCNVTRPSSCFNANRTTLNQSSTPSFASWPTL